MCVRACVRACVCVCVCVYGYSRATGYKVTIKRYQRPQLYKAKRHRFLHFYKPRMRIISVSMARAFSRNRPEGSALLISMNCVALYMKYRHVTGIGNGSRAQVDAVHFGASCQYCGGLSPLELRGKAISN